MYSRLQHLVNPILTNQMTPLHFRDEMYQKPRTYSLDELFQSGSHLNIEEVTNFSSCMNEIHEMEESTFAKPIFDEIHICDEKENLNILPIV